MRYGEYATKKDRDEYGKELRVAHFQLGNDHALPLTSYSSDFAGVKETKDADKGEHKVDAKTLSKSNFIFGMDKMPKESLYKKEFMAKQAEKVALDKEVIKDLRETHYNLGNDPRDFRSIQKQDYCPPEAQEKSGFTIDTMKSKMRTHNFKFGDDAVAYQSSNSSTYRHPSTQPNANKAM